MFSIVGGSCLACGYSLDGLGVPGVCPECGTAFERQSLVLHGVPQRISGSPARRAMWIAFTIVAFLHAQTLMYQIVWFWPMAVTISAGLLGGLVYLVSSSPRERRGVERFIFTPAGVARASLAPLKGDRKLAVEFCPYAGATAIELQRVSAVWYRLRIGLPAQGSRPGGRVQPSVFDAGVRCTDAMSEPVRRVIQGYLTGVPVAFDEQGAVLSSPPPLHPPTERPGQLLIPQTAPARTSRARGE